MEEKGRFTSNPTLRAVSPPPALLVEKAAPCGQTTVPIWKIPFPNHPGPTSIAILPHREQRAIYYENHQRQGSNTKFRHEELPLWSVKPSSE